MQTKQAETPGRALALESALVGTATFLIYAWGACRTIFVGDSGELVAAAATLGIPHPSGYPLYVLLGKLWIILVPVGSVAFRMSLFSAFWAAAADGAFLLLLRRWGLDRTVAWVAVGAAAFGPSFWSQANIQRVYSLNALFVLVVTWLALEWFRDRKTSTMAWAALAAGLGACNHTFLGVYGLAVGVFAVATERSLLRRPLEMLKICAAGLAGLLPYLYLPLRSRMDPRLDWGNPETLGGFLKVVGRRDFWQRSWLEGPADLLPVLVDFLTSLGEELSWAGAVLAVVGATLGWRRGWPVSLPLLGMAANWLSMALHGSRSDLFIWHRYYIPAYLLAVLLAAWGLQIAKDRWGRLVPGLAAAIPLTLLLSGWVPNDRSRFRIAEDFSRNLLSTLPPGAHLSASDDNILFVLIYLHLVEGVRPDVDLILQGVGDAQLPALRFDPDTDPLFFTHHPNWNHPQIDLEPVGWVFRTVRAGAPPREIPWTKSSLEGENDPRVPKDYLTRNLIGHFHYMLGVTYESRDWPRAVRSFEKAASVASTNDVLFYNLGLIYQRNGQLRRSLEAFERAAEINPRQIPSQNPVRPSDRVDIARGEVERLDRLEQELMHQQAGVWPEVGSAEYHLRLADLLEAAGESLPARGHRLRALEITG